MPDYIERDVALEIVKRTSGDYATAFAEIARCPAVDVAPVRWISVSERLPKEGETVLAVANGNPAPNISLVGACELAAWYSSDGWILETWPEWEGAEITHWMPLPEPPEED